MEYSNNGIKIKNLKINKKRLQDEREFTLINGTIYLVVGATSFVAATLYDGYDTINYLAFLYGSVCSVLGGYSFKKANDLSKEENMNEKDIEKLERLEREEFQRIIRKLKND